MKHRLKQLLVLTMLIAGPIAASAQRNISLDEAIALSLQNSKQLKLSQAKINETHASLKEAQERRLPDFGISGSYLRLAQPTVDLKVKLGGSSQSGETSGSSSGSSGSSIKVNQASYGI